MPMILTLSARMRCAYIICLSGTGCGLEMEQELCTLNTSVQVCSLDQLSQHLLKGPDAQASETVFKGMQDFAEGAIGEGPLVEDRGIFFQGELFSG